MQHRVGRGRRPALPRGCAVPASLTWTRRWPGFGPCWRSRSGVPRQGRSGLWTPCPPRRRAGGRCCTVPPSGVRSSAD